MIDIKRAVMQNRTVHLDYYRDGALWYRTEFGEIFPVPVEDVGTATFNGVEKASLLMRWMRKWNQKIELDSIALAG